MFADKENFEEFMSNFFSFRFTNIKDVLFIMPHHERFKNRTKTAGSVYKSLCFIVFISLSFSMFQTTRHDYEGDDAKNENKSSKLYHNAGKRVVNPEGFHELLRPAIIANLC